jgi:hypothetical protein
VAVQLDVLASVSEVAQPAVALVVVVVEPLVVFGVVVAVQLDVLASVSEVAQPGVALVVVVVEPLVVFVVVAVELDVLVSVSEVAQPGVALVVVVVESQAAVDIAPAVDVLVPVSVVAVEVDSPGRPRFLAFPNVDYSASSSSSVAVGG